MTLDELKELIASDEGETVEVKESTGQAVTPARRIQKEKGHDR